MDVKLSCAGWCATTTARGAPWPAFGALGALAIGDDCRRCGRATVVRCSAEQRTVRRRRRLEISHNADVAATSVADREEYVRRGQRPDGGHILFGRTDYDGHASRWLMETGGGAPVEVCRLQISDALGNENCWFGFYGYTDWREAFDWRRRS